MTNVFPDSGNGGVLVRNPDGTPIPVTNVPNAYVPLPAFTTNCQMTYLQDDCFSRVAPAQVNAIVSELICFAEGLTPNGEWDCSSLCNIRTAFEAFMADFASQQIGDQLCEVIDGDGTEATARLIYCTDGVAKGLPITGDNGLLTLMFSAICGTPIELSTTPGTTLLYCDGDGNVKKLTLGSIQLFRGEYVQAYTYTTNMMVRRQGKLYSPNANIPGGTPFAIGTTGETWYEVSPAGAAPPFDITQSHLKNSIVTVNGKYYAANEDIPANTPFVVGTSGLTWREVDLTNAFILEHDPTVDYQRYAVVTKDGSLYRATNGAIAASAFNPNQWELIGGERNIWRGPHVQALAYRKDDVVVKDNLIYAANNDIPAGTLFTVGTSGATWKQLGTKNQMEISFSVTGGWTINETWLVYPVRQDEPFTLPANLSGSAFSIVSGALVDGSLSLRKNGVEFGMLVIASNVITVTSAQTSFAPGDTFSIMGVTAATFDAIGFNLLGTTP